jgi:HSP20 family molecular chaperone IbpA
MEIQKDIAAAALAINVGLFPTMKDLGDAYEIILDIPDVQELEFNTEVVDQNLILSGKLTVTVERSSNGYRGTSSSSRDFSYSLKLPQPIDESAVVSKREDGRIVVILPKTE